MLDLQQVHLLSDGLRRGAMRATPEPDVADPFALATERTVPQQPLVFRQFMGRRVYDLVGTGYAPLILVSQRSSMRLRGPHARLVDLSHRTHRWLGQAGTRLPWVGQPTPRGLATVCR